MAFTLRSPAPPSWETYVPWIATGALVAVAIGLLLAVPLYNGNGLLFGMHGEIKPSEYPAGCRLSVPCVHLIACAVAVVIILFVAAAYIELQV